MGDGLVAVQERWEVAYMENDILQPLSNNGSGFPGLPCSLGAGGTAAACCPVLPGQGY